MKINKEIMIAASVLSDLDAKARNCESMCDIWTLPEISGGVKGRMGSAIADKKGELLNETNSIGGEIEAIHTELTRVAKAYMKADTDIASIFGRK